MYPKLIKNFIEEKDILMFNELVQKNIIFKNNQINESDNRIFEWNSELAEAAYIVRKYSRKIIKDQKIYVHVAMFVKYLPGSFVPLHTDIMSRECSNDQLSLVLYFNQEYSGGEIYFPNIKKQYKPETGSALYYPPYDKNFEHGVNVVTEGEKYILALCFTSKKNLAPPQYL